jgi:GDP/UDP-N,N'-diacetylbacillosamine 2-epimerase (hydrolysing)
MAPDDLWRDLGFDPAGKPFALVVQHSILTDVERSGEHMSTTLDSLVRMGLPSFVSYPNSDAGSQRIIDVIESFARRFPDLIHRYQNLPRSAFVNLLRRAHVLVGNSSCGIIEAPLFHIPVVNAGPRQRGREHAENVLFVDHDLRQIQEAVRKSLSDPEHRRKVAACVNPYGDGRAGRRIADILASQEIDDRLRHKRNTY